MTSNITAADSKTVLTAAFVVGASLLGLMASKAMLFPAKKTSPQVIFITGASSGIGKTTALQLIKEGHIVYGAARRPMQHLIDAGGHSIQMDVTNEGQIVQAVERIMNEQGRIDVLINNAGYAVYGSVEDITIPEAQQQFQVNLFGLARLTQEVLPHMRKAGQGRIILMSSMGGKIYTPFGSWYHATKHAVEGWGDCLRLELKPFGIDVVIIEPGMIRTEFGDVAMKPALERSKGGPYEAFMIKYADSFEQNQSMLSDPSVVTKAVSQAVVLKTPRRRYLIGSMAKPLVYMRAMFGDGFYDAMMMPSFT